MPNINMRMYQINVIKIQNLQTTVLCGRTRDKSYTIESFTTVHTRCTGTVLTVGVQCLDIFFAYVVGLWYAKK